MRVLITGASGFIGRQLATRLAEDHDVIGVSFAADQPAGGRRLSWKRWDIRQPADKEVVGDGLDAVIHLAQAHAYRQFPKMAPEITRVNVEGVINALEAARAAGARRFLFASSGGVYAPGSGVRTEDDRPEPQSFYQATKLAGEVLASRYRDFFDVTCLRIFFAYGRGQKADRFVTELVRRVVTGDPVQLAGPDGMRANPIHLDDVVKSFRLALEANSPFVINLAGPEVLTLRQMSDLIGMHVGRKPVFEQSESAPGDLVASTALMSRCLDAPAIRFESRIAEVCAEVSGALAS